MSEGPSRHLLIVDDHPLFRGALRKAITGLFDRADVAEAGTFEEVSGLLDRGGGDVDLILLDLSMPGVRGLSGLMYLRAQYPSLPIVVVSANEIPPWRGLAEFAKSRKLLRQLAREARAQRLRKIDPRQFPTPLAELEAKTELFGW